MPATIRETRQERLSNVEKGTLHTTEDIYNVFSTAGLVEVATRYTPATVAVAMVFVVLLCRRMRTPDGGAMDPVMVDRETKFLGQELGLDFETMRKALSQGRSGPLSGQIVAFLRGEEAKVIVDRAMLPIAHELVTASRGRLETKILPELRNEVDRAQVLWSADRFKRLSELAQLVQDRCGPQGLAAVLARLEAETIPRIVAAAEKSRERWELNAKEQAKAATVAVQRMAEESGSILNPFKPNAVGQAKQEAFEALLLFARATLTGHIDQALRYALEGEPVRGSKGLLAEVRALRESIEQEVHSWSDLLSWAEEEVQRWFFRAQREAEGHVVYIGGKPSLADIEEAAERAAGKEGVLAEAMRDLRAALRAGKRGPDLKGELAQIGRRATREAFIDWTVERVLGEQASVNLRLLDCVSRPFAAVDIPSMRRLGVDMGERSFRIVGVANKEESSLPETLRASGAGFQSDDYVSTSNPYSLPIFVEYVGLPLQVLGDLGVYRSAWVREKKRIAAGQAYSLGALPVGPQNPFDMTEKKETL